MIYAVSGGKGGVGKTTFALFLAIKQLKEGKKVLLVDADVDAPNIDLIVRGEYELVKEVKRPYPSFGKECIGCRKCVESCPEHAIYFIDRPHLVKELCSSCMLCELVCPVNAIREVEEVCGWIYGLEKGNLKVLVGKAKVGVRETGPIVRELVQTIDSIDHDVCIIDTSPGIHCNVIQALLKADFVYLVAEPTPLSVISLKQMFELCEKLKKEFEVVINKSNLGNAQIIRDLCSREKVRIAYEIPYKKEIFNAYIEGYESLLRIW